MTLLNTGACLGQSCDDNVEYKSQQYSSGGAGILEGFEAPSTSLFHDWKNLFLQ
jgi:hypothetical protein